MSKQPIEVRDRFAVRFVTDSTAQFGDAIAALTKLGIRNIEHELITDVVRFKNNQQHEVNATEFLETWTQEHPIFQQKEILKHFKDAGRQNGAAYYAIKQLLEKGVIKKIDDNGNYTRADVRQIEPPKKEAAAKPAKAPMRDHFDVDHREFILRYARQHNGRFSLAKLREHFAKHKRKPSSIGGAVHHLQQKKLIKSLGAGEFVLLTKSAAKPPKPPTPKAAPPPPKANGAQETMTMMVTRDDTPPREVRMKVKTDDTTPREGVMRNG